MPLYPHCISVHDVSAVRACRQAQLELKVTRTTSWTRIKLPSEVPLVTHFQPRTILRMEQVVDLAPGSLFDYMGIAVGQTQPMPGARAWASCLLSGHEDWS